MIRRRMSLRTRLIIAFLLLSVVPLTAVTLFSYISSVNAVENAARRAASDDAADYQPADGCHHYWLSAGAWTRFSMPARTSPHGATDHQRHAQSRRAGARRCGGARRTIRVSADRGSQSRLQSRCARTRRRGPKSPTVPKLPAPPKPPTPPAIVVDVPRIMEQAEQAARAHSAASPEAAPFIDFGFNCGPRGRRSGDESRGGGAGSV